MQQHALVGLGDVERRAHLLGAVALDVAHADDGLLGEWQLGDGAHGDANRLAVLDASWSAAVPVGRERAPAARVRLVRAAEAFGVDGRRVVLGRQRGERHAARLARAARLGLVDEDREDPRLQRRAALEAVEAVDDAEPGLLHDLLRDRAVLHVGARHREHRAVEAGDERLERLLVAGAETFEQRGFGGGGVRALEGDLGHARRTYRRDMAAVHRTHAAVTSTSTRPACTAATSAATGGVEPGRGQSLRELVVRRDVDAPDAVLVGRDLVAVDVAEAAAALLAGAGGEAAHRVGGRAGRAGEGADRDGLPGVGADVIGAMVLLSSGR